MSATHTDLTTPEQITAETKSGSIFEKATCSRCGGSGQFGPRVVMAGRCFKCHGAGVVYTKRGAEARRYFLALRTATTAGLRVGDRVYDSGMAAGDMVFQRAGWHTVEALTDNSVAQTTGHILKDPERILEAVEQGASAKPTTLDGEPAMVVYGGVNVETTGVTFSGSGPERRFLVSDRDTLVACMKAAAEYQLALTKTGKPRKGSRYDEAAA